MWSLKRNPAFPLGLKAPETLEATQEVSTYLPTERNTDGFPALPKQASSGVEAGTPGYSPVLGP